MLNTVNGWSQNCFMIYDPTSKSAGVWQRQVLVFPPRSVNKQTTTCEMKYVHWSDLDDDVGKKSNTSSTLKFFMVVGTHLCKMATLLCHPTLSRTTMPAFANLSLAPGLHLEGSAEREQQNLSEVTVPWGRGEGEQSSMLIHKPDTWWWPGWLWS